MINNIEKLKSSMSINTMYNKSATDSYKEIYNDKVLNDWQYASDIYNIQEEVPYGSKLFKEIETRVCKIKNADTNYKGDDDWRKLLFKVPDGHYGIGGLYYFFDNYWLTTKTDILGSVTDDIVVRRCNNILKWIDSNGNYYEEPCIFDYKMTRNINTKTTDVTSVSGFTTILLQRNSRTQTLRSNQRFLLGTPELWNAVKIAGAGINNYLNQKTGDYSSNSIIEISVISSEVNTDTDDLINGIADVKKLEVTTDFSYDNINGSINDTFKMTCELKQDNVILNGRTFEYKSEDDSIATVSGDIVTLVGEGETNLICNIYYENKIVRTVYIPIKSIASIESRIVVDNFSNYILQGKTEIFIFSFYNGNVKDENALFSYKILDNKVPKDNYQMIISEDTATLKIKNLLMYLNNPLKIEVGCNNLVYEITVLLKGKY